MQGFFKSSLTFWACAMNEDERNSDGIPILLRTFYRSWKLSRWSIPLFQKYYRCTCSTWVFQRSSQYKASLTSTYLSIDRLLIECVALPSIVDFASRCQNALYNGIPVLSRVWSVKLIKALLKKKQQKSGFKTKEITCLATRIESDPKEGAALLLTSLYWIFSLLFFPSFVSSSS